MSKGKNQKGLMVVEATGDLPFAFTRHGLVVKRAFTEMEFEDWWVKTEIIHEVSGLALGDLYNAAVKAGMEDMVLQRLIPDPGSKHPKDQVTIKTVKNRAWIALAIPESRRHMDTLDLSHHDAVASLPPVEQDRILNMAEKGDWNVGRTRDESKKWKDKQKKNKPHAENIKPAKDAQEKIHVTFESVEGRAEAALRKFADLAKRGWIEVVEVRARVMPGSEVQVYDGLGNMKDAKVIEKWNNGK